jgi:ABC-type nitrate/sulfonate/bicarbonate transport system permease component
VFPSVVSDPAFRKAALDTLSAVAEGLLIAIVLGTLIGLVMGRSPTMERLLRHYINGFYAVPMIIVLPLFSLWFGYSGAARLATVIFAAIFSIIVNVADGAKAVPRDYLEVARSFGSSRLRLMIDVVLPAATPYFLAGLRLAAGRAMIGAVVAEFFIAMNGSLGYFVLYQSRTFHHSEAFVGVIALAGSCVGFELLVNWCTRHYLPWYRRDESTA